MRSYLYKTLAICIFLAGQIVVAQNAESYFELGNKEYASENWKGALDQYNQVLDKGFESASLYFNMGNASYKLNRIGPSIYYYEKALQLNPADAAARNNIAFARKMTVDAITPLPENTFKKWRNRVLNLLSIDGWARLTVTLMMLSAVFFLGYYFMRTTGRKRLLFTASFVALFIGLISLAFAFQSRSQNGTDRPAIVFASQVEVKGEPSLESAEAFVLHEGTKVRVMEDVDEWKRIRIADGTEGWILAEEIKEL